MAHDVLGIGSPFVDHIIEITDAYLARLAGEKGGMSPVDYNTLHRIIQESNATPLIMYGGSGANTIKGLANLGHQAALFGKVGVDPAGKKFLEKIHTLNIKSYLKVTDTPTAQAVCLITPDKERTMRSFLGASQEVSQHDLNPELFHNVKLVHIEGYQLLNEGVVKRTMELAKAAGAKISFDLGSFEIVHKHSDEILRLLTDYVDILFGNEAEIHALTQLSPERGCRILKDLCHTVIVLLGSKGCIVGRESVQIHTPAIPAKPIDTTGAGDLFASGFLHGFLEGRSLEQCAYLGTLAGASVVEILGVDIPPQMWADIKEKSLNQSQG